MYSKHGTRKHCSTGVGGGDGGVVVVYLKKKLNLIRSQQHWTSGILALGWGAYTLWIQFSLHQDWEMFPLYFIFTLPVFKGVNERLHVNMAILDLCLFYRNLPFFQGFKKNCLPFSRRCPLHPVNLKVV